MSSEVQSVLIPRAFFTKRQAVKYIEDNGFKNKKVDITDDFYRFRQKAPSKFKKFRTKQLDNGVELIIGFPKK